MKNDTSTIQLKVMMYEINSKLDHLNVSNVHDIWLKWVTLGVTFLSVLVALYLFDKTKKKEYTYKKSDICGEIIECFFDFKRNINQITYQTIVAQSSTRVFELLSDDLYIFENYYDEDGDRPDKNYYAVKINESTTIIKEYKDEMIKTRRKLEKLFTQYKFYIIKSDHKKKFDDCLLMFKTMNYFSFDFSKAKDEKEVDEITKKMFKNYQGLIKKEFEPRLETVTNYFEKYN